MASEKEVQEAVEKIEQIAEKPGHGWRKPNGPLRVVRLVP